MSGKRITRVIAYSLLAVALLPILATAFAAAGLINASVEANVTASLESITRAASLECERSLRPVYRVLDSLALFVSGGSDQSQVARFIEASQRARTDIDSLMLLDAEGRVEQASPPDERMRGDDLSLRPEYARARETNGVVMSPPFVALPAGTVTVAAYRKMGTRTGVIHLNLQDVAVFLDRLRLSDADHVAIADRAGRFIAHSDMRLVREQRYAPILPRDRRVARTSLEGRRFYLLAREVMNSDLVVLYYRDEAEARAVIGLFLGWIGLIAATALAAAAAVAMSINRTLSAPFHALVKEASGIAAGNYGRRLAGDWPAELSAIAEAFNAMAENVESRDRDLKESEEQLRKDRDEKVVMLKEIHHRVKNNLQIISSLLHLQSRFIRDPEDLALFRSSENRVYSMALTHELLYQSADLSSIAMAEYGERLVSYLREAFPDPRFRIETDFRHFTLPLERALPCGLVLNELITNALKYALPGAEDPRLRVALRLEEGEDSDRPLVRLEVADRGPGIGQDGGEPRSESLGFSLISSLSAQLGGTMSFRQTEPGAPNPGLTAVLRFPRLF